MKIVRTFHPVGQGAFYTEIHNTPNGELRVVYDCGSKTLSGKELRKLIHSVFRKGEVINALFISHFHVDHINGIQFLKDRCIIKKVIIPLRQPEAKSMQKLENFLSNETELIGLIDDPRGYFGEEVPVHEIMVNDGDAPVNTEDQFNLDGLISEQKLPSGSTFKFSGQSDWIYIPFNYEEVIRVNEFREKIEKQKLQFERLDEIDYVIKNLKKIREAYNEISGKGDGLNENSLIVFSGSTSQFRTSTYQRGSNLLFFDDFGISTKRPSCIYFGDSDLTSTGLIPTLGGRLGLFSGTIGTIQIPHHGSVLNFDRGLWQYFKPIFGVISFGTNNNYGHPSTRVIGDIHSERTYPILVTEHLSSLTIQCIEK